MNVNFVIFHSYLVCYGIHHRFICPHPFQHNGIIERKRRHLVEFGLTLPTQGYVPFKFWSDAFATVVYLINRLPTYVLNHKVPYEKLFNKSSCSTFLRIFGCLCFPHVRDFNKHKFDYKSRPCVFLGYYSSTYIGYKFIDKLR